MDNTIIVALVSGMCTLIGTLGGIVASGKLTSYRLEQLEKKVDKHNKVIERTYNLEKQTELLSEKIKVANNRIGDLEDITKALENIEHHGSET